jgi:hypothetical protein
MAEGTNIYLDIKERYKKILLFLFFDPPRFTQADVCEFLVNLAQRALANETRAIKSRDG